MTARYTATFSHEFAAGRDSPARSYWTIHGPGAADHAVPIALHHRESGMQVDLQATSIAHMLNVAFEEGRRDKAREIKRALEIK